MAELGERMQCDSFRRLNNTRLVDRDRKAGPPGTFTNGRQSESRSFRPTNYVPTNDSRAAQVPRFSTYADLTSCLTESAK